MAKQISYSEEGRQYLKTGVDKLTNAVKVTLGPKGKTVILSRKFGSPTIIDDGVTIAKEIELENNEKNDRRRSDDTSRACDVQSEVNLR